MVFFDFDSISPYIKFSENGLSGLEHSRFPYLLYLLISLVFTEFPQKTVGLLILLVCLYCWFAYIVGFF